MTDTIKDTQNSQQEFLDEYFPKLNKAYLNAFINDPTIQHPLKPTITKKILALYKEKGSTLTTRDLRKFLNPYLKRKRATKPQTGDRLFPFYIENGKVNQFKSRIFVSDDLQAGVVVLTYFDVVSTKRKDGRIYGNEMEEIWANDKLISSSKQRVKYALNLHDDPNKPFYYIKHFKHFDD
jgi:hypothetical protein